MTARWLSAICGCLLALVGSGTLAAKAFDMPPAVGISPGALQVELGQSAFSLEDPPGNLSIGDLLSGQPGDWKPIQTSVPNFGYTASAYWLRLAVENESAAPRRMLLNIGYALLDELDVYLIAPDGRIIQSYSTGDSHPFDTRFFPHREFLFPIELEPVSTQGILIRLASTSSLQAPLSLIDSNEFARLDHQTSLLQGFYYGSMVVMALYNLFLFVSLRRADFLIYVAFLCSFIAFQFSMSGLAFQHLWPQAVVWNQIAISFFMSQTLMWMALLVRQFLRLPEREPLVDRVMVVLAGLSGLLTILSLFLPYQKTIFPLLGLALTLNSLALVMGVKRSLTGDRSAQFFTLAWFVTLVGALVIVLSKVELIPRTFFTEHALQIGTLLEILLISFALGEYVNQQRRARSEAEKRHSLQLEDQVRDRTSELENTMLLLENANQKLKQQTYIDELTGLHNRRYFNQRLEQDFNQASRSHSPISLIMIDVDHFKMVNDTHGHQIGDLCLRQVAGVMGSFPKRASDVFARYGGEEFIVVLPGTDQTAAMMIAEKMRAHVAAAPLGYKNQRTGQRESVALTISAGVACLVPTAEQLVDELLRQADEALYHAKVSGRNQVVSHASIRPL
ncbi:diguanylate cyclase [Allohahella sp. A8]|uniref:sensor domain-containing diguanylate cyclase n=1 Tax=Allohahella sp. A8 TaxID=3141461 RepID=UPI003A80FB9C